MRPPNQKSESLKKIKKIGKCLRIDVPVLGEQKIKVKEIEKLKSTLTSELTLPECRPQLYSYQ